MLFFCKWTAATSLLVDDVDEAHAREVAADVAGEPPSQVIPLAPRAFVAEVYPDDEGLLVVEPLEHVEDLLAVLDGDGEDGEDDGEDCGHEAEADGGDVFVCTLPIGHDGEHEARNAQGAKLASWPVEDAGATQ